MLKRVQRPKAPFGLCEFVEDLARCAKPARWVTSNDYRLCWKHLLLYRRETRSAPPEFQKLEEVKLPARRRA